MLLRCILASVSLAMLLVACDESVGWAGFYVYAQNESGRAIVVRNVGEKWPIGAGEIRELAPHLSGGVLGHPQHYDILDAASCEAIGDITIDFSVFTFGAMIVVPPSGPVTAFRPGEEPKASGVVGAGEAQPSDVCLGPIDGWGALIVNPSSTTYSLTVTRSEYTTASGPYTVTVPPKGSGRVHSQVADGGAFVLTDSDCALLGSLSHDPWGRFVVTITDGGLDLQPGPVPSDAPDLTRAAKQCPEVVASPSP